MATLCYGVLDPERGEIDLAMAGHLPPVLVAAECDPAFVDAPAAPPIGADPLSRYAHATFRLPVGSTLYLYTDGLVERRGEALDAGLDRLCEVAGTAPSVLDDACEHLIDGLVGASRPTDDVAVLALRFTGSPRGHLRVRRPARPAELAPIRRIVSSWLGRNGFAGEEVGSISVALNEAATNAIEHAYGIDEGWFEVEADIDDAGAVSLVVRDGGHWRTKAHGGGGRGLALIGRLMDTFEIRRRPAGTEIWMRRAPRGEVAGR